MQAALQAWDKQGRYVFSRRELAKFFPQDSAKAFSESLNRHVHHGLIERACRSVYVNQTAASFDGSAIDRIAQILRSGCYNYVSLESALSDYGAISQVPVGRLTVMTTGRSGVYHTPYGTIEFTHTKRSVENILENTAKTKVRPLRVAFKSTAWRDLKRVGRNTHLVDASEVENG